MTKLKNLLSGAPSAIMASALLLSVCGGCGGDADTDSAPKTDAPAASSGTDSGSSSDAATE